MELGHTLLEHFGNQTKVEHAQSILISIQQGKGETAYDYALCCEVMRDKFQLMRNCGLGISSFGDCSIDVPGSKIS